MATLPLLLSAYLSKPSNVIYVSKVFYYDKNLTLTQNMPGNLSFSENDFLLNSGLKTVYNNLINYINLINPTDIPVYSPLSSLQYGDYFINPSANNFQPTQVIQDSTSSNVNNSKIINFVATVNTDDLNFGTVKPDYTSILTNINTNLSNLNSKFTGDIGYPVASAPTFYELFYCLISSFQNSAPGVIRDQLYQNCRNNSQFKLLNNKLQTSLTNLSAADLLELIKQAILTLSSSNDNLALKDLKEAISALELKVDVNNVMQIDGTQEFRLRPFAKNYDDNEVEDI